MSNNTPPIPTSRPMLSNNERKKYLAPLKMPNTNNSDKPAIYSGLTPSTYLPTQTYKTTTKSITYLSPDEFQQLLVKLRNNILKGEVINTTKYHKIFERLNHKQASIIENIKMKMHNNTNDKSRLSNLFRKAYIAQEQLTKYYDPKVLTLGTHSEHQKIANQLKKNIQYT